MPIIKPKGLLRGDRLAELSDDARLYWPFLYAGSTGFGTFELDYKKILDKCFCQFTTKPSRTLVTSMLREYRDRSLLFLYTAPDGKRWGAWDSAAVQSFYSKEDYASPKPPEPAFSNWKRQYQESKRISDHDSLDLDSDGLADSRTDTNFKEIDNSTISALNSTDTNRTSGSIHQSSETSSASENINARANVLEMRRPPQIEQVIPMPLAVNGSPPPAPHDWRRPFPTPSPPDATCELWCGTRYMRHRKKKNKDEAIPRLRMIYRDPVKRRLFEKNHELWRETVDWRKENGRYCPPLDEWIDNDGYVDAPESIEGTAVSKPGKTGSEIE